MNTNNNYLVYINEDGVRFYYRNRMLHRRIAPAIVVPEDKQKYTRLEDEYLYKEIWDFEDLKKAIGESYLIAIVPTFSILFYESQYYLNDFPYSEKEFYAILLKDKMEEELFVGESLLKQVKI